MISLRNNFFLLFLLFVSNAWAGDPAAYLLGEIKAASAVNVRKSASPAAAVVGSARPHDQYLVYKKEHWYLLLDGPFVGAYIYEDFIQLTGKKYPIGKLIPDGVRLYKSPDKVVGGTGRLNEVFAVEDSGEWFHIMDGPNRGLYVRKTAVNILDKAPIIEMSDSIQPAFQEQTAEKEKKPEAHPPDWDEKKEKLFQEQVEKAFGSRKKKEDSTPIVMPFYFDIKPNPLGHVDSLIREGQSPLLEPLAISKFLRQIVDAKWFEKPEVKAIGLLSASEVESTKNPLPEKDWIPANKFENTGIKLVYDEKKLDLRVSVPPELRGIDMTQISSRYAELIDNLEKPSAFSSYININSSETIDTKDSTYGDHRSPMRAQLENGTNIFGNVLEAFGTYTESRSENPNVKTFERSDVRLVRDIQTFSVRASVGDVVYPVQRYQIYKPMGGFAVTSQFGMRPSKLTYPTGDFEVFLQKDSKVYVYVNDHLTQVLNLTAGRHQLKDFPFSAGMNNVRLEILDDVGRTEVQNFSYFSSSELLQSGLSKFSYAYGNPSESLDGERTYQTKSLISAYHLYGVNDYFTVGGNYQSLENQSVIGLSGLVSTDLGYFNLETGVSSDQRVGGGAAAALRYLYMDRLGENNSQRSFNAGLAYQSSTFSNINTTSASSLIEFYELLAGYTQAITQDISGTLGLKAQVRQKTNPSIQDPFSVYAGLAKRWENGLSSSLTLTHAKNDNGDEDISAMFFLIMAMPKQSQVITFTGNTSEASNRADWSYNPSSGADTVNYSADIKDTKTESGYGGQINYNGNRARVMLGHEIALSKDTTTTTTGKKQSNNVTTLQLGTALAFAGGHFAISRPVTDSFAIVAPVKNLKGQSVEISPDVQGHYNAKTTSLLGNAANAEISSYNLTTLTVGGRSLTSDVSLPKDHFDLFPTYKSGYAFELGTNATVYLVAKILSPEGAAVESAAGEAVFLDDPKEPPITVFTNKRGLLRSEGFRPGKYRLRMAAETPQVIEFTIPENTAGEYDIGTLKLQGK